MIPPQPSLDPRPATGKVSGMIRRMLHTAIRSSLQEAIEPSLIEIKTAIVRLEGGQGRLESRLDKLEVKIDASTARLDQTIDAVGHRLDTKMDALGQRLDAKMDALGQRLDSRIDTLGQRLDTKTDIGFGSLTTRFDSLTSRFDAFSIQQADLIKEVAALKRDHTATEDIHRRLFLLESRYLAPP